MDAVATKTMKTNKKAIISLALGLISIILFFTPYGFLSIGLGGVIFGAIGLGEIKRQEQPGKSMAIAGIVASFPAVIYETIAIIYLYI